MATPKLRFNEFNEKWEEKKLGKICQHFKSGKSITSKYITDTGDYPVYGGNGLRGFTTNFTHDGKFILIGRQGALCGNVQLASGKNYISEHAIAVQADQKNSTDWLAYWLDNMKLNRFSESSAQPGLAVNKLIKFKIKLPTKAEQTKIATFLSAVDTKIDELTQKHELLTDYKKGMMQQIFSQKVRFKGFSASWNDIKVGSLGTFNSGGTPSKKNSAYWKGDIPWISSSDLTEDSIFEVMTTRYITREAIDNSATKIIPKNSVLIVSRVGVGKVAVNSSQLCTSQDFTSLTPFEDNPVFLAYLLKSKASRLLEFNQGTSIKGFVRDDLINLSVSIPTKEEQTKIADFLTTIDQKIDNVAEQIDHAKTWKKGLLQQMFV